MVIMFGGGIKKKEKSSRLSEKQAKLLFEAWVFPVIKVEKMPPWRGDYKRTEGKRRDIGTIPRGKGERGSIMSPTRGK